MAARVQVRLPEARREAWAQAANQEGLALSEYVRRAVEDQLAGRTPKAIARAVSGLLLPEIEMLLQRNGTQEPPAPARPFDPSCYSADLHRQGVVCNECGGSFVVRA